MLWCNMNAISVLMGFPILFDVAGFLFGLSSQRGVALDKGKIAYGNFVV